MLFLAGTATTWAPFSQNRRSVYLGPLDQRVGTAGHPLAFGKMPAIAATLLALRCAPHGSRSVGEHEPRNEWKEFGIHWCMRHQSI